MKAVLCTAYGPPEVLRLMDIPTPSPKPNEVLVKVKFSTVTFGDCEIRNLTLPAWTRLPVRLIMGYRKPKHLIPGMEFSGVVEVVGSKVVSLKPGDKVFGSTGMKMGGNAEFVSRAAASIAVIPHGVSFENAATIPVGGINALHFLRLANLQAGQRVLVIGAGGSIGTWGVLLGKYYGAEVTAVDRTDKLGMLRDIGADHVIDYTREDFSDNGIQYDAVLDLVYKSSFSKCFRATAKNGCYLMANTGPLRMLRGIGVEMFSSRRVKFALASETTTDFNHLAALVQMGKIKPVIDRAYPLEQTIEAHRHVEQGMKKGSVLIQVS